MRVPIFKYWDRVRSSFWFLPTVMAGGAVGLSFISVALDDAVTGWLSLTWGWTFTGGAQGASSVLGAIAGSMITLAGVVFSMTLVALSLASSQLGPRLLRNFMRDTTTQVVLGTFVSTFLYCLLVLRTIRRADEVAFVPHMSTTLGVLLAVVSVGVLIYFVHHVSISIQANEIVARVGKELIEGLDRQFPEHIGQGAREVPTAPPSGDLLEAFNQESLPVASDADGYVQFIDASALMALAIQEDVIFRLERSPGHYVVADCPLVMVWPGDRAIDHLRGRVNAIFVLGNQRAAGQDFAFTINQLVEVAVRALSPGVNDPFTAIACVDHLGSALCRLATRHQPSPYRHDPKGKLRVIAHIVDFPALTDAAFNQIRQYSTSSASVLIRLLDTIAVIAGFAHRPADRAALVRHADMIDRGARGGLSELEDRRTVEEHYQATLRRCRAS